MKQTTYYALTYPEAGDHTRTWEYWQATATQVETLLKNGFRIPAGPLSLGDPAAVTIVPLNLDKLDGADAYRAQLYIGPSGYLTLGLTKNGAEVHRIRFGPDETIFMGKSGQPIRIVPYATHSVVSTIVGNGTATTPVKTITYPAGRFTAPPVLSLTAQYVAGITLTGTCTATGMSITGYYPVAGGLGNGAAYGIQCLSTQMSPAGEGLLRAAPADAPPMVDLIATCHTPGCHNAEIPLELTVPDPPGTIECGVCGQPIDDVTPAA